MSHFGEARENSLAALQAAADPSVVERVCMIVDLRGMFRALVKPVKGADTARARETVRAALKASAEMFWSDEVWVDSEDSTQAQRALFDLAWQESRAVNRSNRVFILDRRLSKDAWFGSPFDPPWPLNEHTPPIISFYSFKGGVGRTTALLAVATNLARKGERVVCLDLDLEAPGVGGALAGDPTVLPRAGVVDFLLEYPLSGASLDIAEFYSECSDPAIIRDGESIWVVPAGAVDPSYLEKLARVNYSYLYQYASEKESGRSPLHAMLRMLRDRLSPSVFLIDSRAGLHDLGGLTLSGIAHLHALFGLSSAQSWAGLSLAVSHLGKERVLSGATQKSVAVVQTMVSPASNVREDEIRQFKERSFEVFSNYYYEENTDAEYPVPDLEAADSPHFPVVLGWDANLMGYSSVTQVADRLCEGDHRVMSQFVLERVGRML